MRSSSFSVTFLHPFSLSGIGRELSAGDYEVLIQDEVLSGHGFETCQRVATYMSVPGRDGRVGWMELLPVSEGNLREALKQDRCTTDETQQGEAALSPQEDLK